MAEPMTPERLAYLRKLHVEDTSLTDHRGCCRGCAGFYSWPCIPAQLLAEVDRLRAQVAAVRNACGDRKSGGSPLLSGREVLALLDRAALASGDEVQP